MRSVSSSLLSFIASTGRTFKSRLVSGINTYENIVSLKISAPLVTNNDICIGCAPSACMEVSIRYSGAAVFKGCNFTAQIAAANSTDWLTLGTFKAEKPTKQNGVLSFTAYDAMSSFTGTYTTAITDDITTVGAVYNEICTSVGMQCVALSAADAALSISPSALSGYTYRQALGYLAAYLGGNAVINSANKVEIRKLSASATAISGIISVDNIDVPEIEEEDYSLGYINVYQNEGDEDFLTVGDGTRGFSCVCPLMTQSRLDTLGTQLLGLSYRVAKVTVMSGDPRIEPGDILSLSYNSETLVIPVMNVVIDFDGGVMNEIESYGTVPGEEEAETNMLARVIAAQRKADEALDYVENIENAVTSVDVMFAVSDSSTTAPTTGWQTTAPELTNGMYMWQKTVTAYANNTTFESDAICITLASDAVMPKSLEINVDRYVVAFNADGTAKDSEAVTITAIQNNFSDAITWITSPNVTLGTVSGNPLERTLAVSNFTSNNEIKVTISAGGLTDTATITKIADGATGASGYTVILGNESHTFSGSETGAVSGSAYCPLYAYKGTERAMITVGTINNLPTGMTYTVYSNETIQAAIRFSVDTTLTPLQRTIQIPLTIKTNFTESGTVFQKIFAYTVALKGKDGIGVSNVKNYYLATSQSSGITSTSSGFTEEVQNVTSTNKYLWNYEEVVYSNGTTVKTDACLIGAYGIGEAGKGISSITEYYATSTSSSTAPTNWQTSVPTMSATNRFLWNYEKITYTDNSTSSTTACVIGVYGEKGATGNTGATGKGVKSVVEQYYLSTSSSTQSGGSWSTTCPAWASGKYIWTRSYITWSDNSTSTTTATLANGINGANEKANSANTKANAVETALANATVSLNKSVASALGYYATETTAADGSKIRYMHNASTLATSTYICRISAEGFAWTKNWNGGNPTWTSGVYSGSNLIMDTISAKKITAGMIAANAITADKIAAGAITADKISAGAITADKISTGAFDSKIAHIGSWDVDTSGISSLYYYYFGNIYTEQKISLLAGKNSVKTAIQKAMSLTLTGGTYNNGAFTATATPIETYSLDYAGNVKGMNFTATGNVTSNGDVSAAGDIISAGTIKQGNYPVMGFVQELGMTSLNNITTTGFYFQSDYAQATAASYYPVEKAGWLEVYKHSALSGVYQRYTAFNGEIYYRICYKETGAASFTWRPSAGRWYKLTTTIV